MFVFCYNLLVNITIYFIFILCNIMSVKKKHKMNLSVFYIYINDFFDFFFDIKRYLCGIKVFNFFVSYLVTKN